MKRFNSWGQLRTVLAVAESGSYRAAGAELGITSSTVARHVDAIAEELGFPVFVPKGVRWELTDVGRELVTIAEKTQTSLGFMMKNLENEGDFFGSLQISTLSFVSSDFLAQSVHLWQRDNPSAKLLIDATDETTAIERGEADVALRLSRPDTPGISRFKVANCNVGIFTPKGGNAKAWVGLSSVLDHLPEMVMARGHFGIEPALRMDSFRAIAEASISTGLSCIIPTCTARDYSELHPAKSTDEPLVTNRELWFLFYEKRKNDLAIIAAKKWIKMVFPSTNKCLCGHCTGS